MNKTVLEEYGATAAGASMRYGMTNEFTKHLGLVRVFAGMYTAVRRASWLRADIAHWLRTTHRQLLLRGIPAEYNLFLGGQHIRRIIRGGASVAVLGYLEMPLDVGVEAMGNPVMQTQNNINIHFDIPL